MVFVPQRGRLFETLKGSETSHDSIVVLAVGVSGINCDAVREHNVDLQRSANPTGVVTQRTYCGAGAGHLTW